MSQKQDSADELSKKKVTSRTQVCFRNMFPSLAIDKRNTKEQQTNLVLSLGLQLSVKRYSRLLYYAL